VYQVPETLVGIVGYGTGVDDVYVSLFLPLHAPVPGSFERAGDGGCFCEVEFASEGVKGYGPVHFVYMPFMAMQIYAFPECLPRRFCTARLASMAAGYKDA
jgi:hypothetical protein